MPGYFGFYEDSNRISTIIESTSFKSKENRKDWKRGGNYRLIDGTLEDFFEGG